MTSRDLERARELMHEWHQSYPRGEASLERAIAAAIADEREANAKVCDGLAQQAIDERERSARDQGASGYSNRPLLAMHTNQAEALTEAASAIRARGES
jgi:hypothetical protein